VLWLLLWLQHQQDEQACNNDYEQEDDLALRRLPLIARGNIQLLFGGFDVGVHPLDVVVYPVQHCTLINYHSLEIPEEIGKLDNALGDVFDLLLPLRNGRVVGLKHPLLGRLERGLGKGAVGVGFLEGRIDI